MASSKSKKSKEDDFVKHLKELVLSHFNLTEINLENAMLSFTEFSWEDETGKKNFIRIFHGSKKASRKDIDTFYKKLKTLGLEKGYIASMKGFSNTVLPYIEENNIPVEIVELDIDPSKKKPKKAKKATFKAKDLKDMVKLAENLIKKHKTPEIITQEERSPIVRDVIGKIEENPIAMIRLIAKESIGVREVRDFAKDLERQEPPVRLAAIIGLKHFSPSAIKEAKEHEIDLISLAEEKEAENRGVRKLNDRLISGARQMLRRMKYEPIPYDDPLYQELGKGVSSLGSYIAGKDPEKPERVILVLIPKEDIVKVHTMREFKKVLDENEIPQGMVIAREKFTYTAIRETDDRIQIIQDNHPVFDIFRHELVPLHELLDPTEEKRILEELGARRYQLPKIRKEDPVIKVLNGKPGQIVKITRSEDAIVYRVII